MDCSTTNKTNKGNKSGGMQCDTSTSKIKDINLPPFRRRSLQPSLSPEIPYELDQLLNAYSNASNHNKVNETRSEVHSMIKNLYQNMFNMIQPIIGKYLANITQLILASNDSVGHHDEANHLTEMSTELCIDDEQDQVGSHICTKLFHTQIIKTEDQGEPNAPTEQNHTHVISDGQGQCIRRIEETENCTILQLPVVDESQLDNQNFISLQLEDIFNDIRPHNVQRDFDIPVNPNIINMV
uniref:Uncharacterized protein n=1 Tax=Oryza punctata TaxID=4537 RepID=A0A0E0MLA9_ORYPU